MPRTSVLVDGFNVYHSLRQASQDLGAGKAGTRWLDLNSLFRSYLPNIRTGLNQPVQMAEIYYFSALPNHMNGAKIARHQNYIRCLESTGVRTELGRFKQKGVWCSACNTTTQHWEEKESDVAISVRLTEVALRGNCEAAVLVTGDTDIAPAVRMVRTLAPNLKVVFAFPYRRKNNELARLADFTINISKENCHRHQFPDPVTLRDGTQIVKPLHW